jgi:hypothetical protein
VLVKLAHRAGWDSRYEIAESLKIGPAMGIWIPFVESAADLARAISAVRGCEGFILWPASWVTRRRFKAP